MYCIRKKNCPQILLVFVRKFAAIRKFNRLRQEKRTQKREREISTELKDVAYPVSYLIIFNELESIWNREDSFNERNTIGTVLRPLIETDICWLRKKF